MIDIDEAVQAKNKRQAVKGKGPVPAAVAPPASVPAVAPPTVAAASVTAAPVPPLPAVSPLS